MLLALIQKELAAIKLNDGLHKHCPKRARWQGLAVEANVGSRRVVEVTTVVGLTAFAPSTGFWILVRYMIFQ